LKNGLVRIDWYRLMPVGVGRQAFYLRLENEFFTVVHISFYPSIQPWTLSFARNNWLWPCGHVLSPIFDETVFQGRGSEVFENHGDDGCRVPVGPSRLFVEKGKSVVHVDG